jgi:DNA-binding HxlR family transcriptional regulator
MAVLARLRRSTAGEIAAALPDIDRHTVSKRLPELERRGSVKRMAARKCTAHGTEMTTWDLV